MPACCPEESWFPGGQWGSSLGQSWEPRGQQQSCGHHWAGCLLLCGMVSEDLSVPTGRMSCALCTGDRLLLHPLHTTPSPHYCPMMHLMTRLLGTPICHTFHPPTQAVIYSGHTHCPPPNFLQDLGPPSTSLPSLGDLGPLTMPPTAWGIWDSNHFPHFLTSWGTWDSWPCPYWLGNLGPQPYPPPPGGPGAPEHDPTSWGIWNFRTTPSS